MSDQPRDWDRELADIDRLMARQGAASAGGTTPAPVATPRGSVPAGAAPVRRRSVALTWFWVGLAVALAAALVLWPYQKACGLQLFFFLGAAGVTLIVGGLGAINSWAHRRGFAHVLSLLVILWAGIAAARETLPRVGYAKAERTWTCAAAPAAAPAAQNPPTQAAPSSQAGPSPAAQTPPPQTTPTTQPAPPSPSPATP
jgi:hypothetical protein